MRYLIIASFIWAFSYGLIKSELTTLDPNFVTVCRMLSAFLVFLPALIIKKNIKWASYFMFIGAVQYGLMYLFVLQAYQYLDAYQVVLFSATTPFYVILLNSLFERQFSIYPFMIAGIAIIGAGIIYNVQLMNTDTLSGFGLVQASDFCFAFGQLAYKKFRQDKPFIQDQDIYAFLFLGALIISVISTTWFGGWHSLQDVSVKQGLILFYLGAIASGVCFFLWNKGVLQMHPVMLSVFNNLKLPLATVVSIVCFHEHLNPSMHLECGLLIIGLALFLAGRYQQKQNAHNLELTLANKL